jgi:hypothetical protein
LITARLRQFEHIVATELPVLFDQFELNTRAREELRRYVKSLENWASGVIKWHLESGRYKNLRVSDSSINRWLLGGPIGLGTSAARIGSLRDAGGSGSAIVVKTSKKWLLGGPVGLGTSVARIGSLRDAGGSGSAIVDKTSKKR